MSQPRLHAIKFDEEKRSQTNVSVDKDVAKLVRQVARVEGRRISDVVHDMLVLFLRTKHPGWHLEFENEDAEPKKIDRREPQPEKDKSA